MKYRVVKEKMTIEDNVRYVAYGIEVIHNKKSIRQISDVSRSYFKVKKLCVLCNRMKLEAIHIDDILEDFLCEL